MSSKGGGGKASGGGVSPQQQAFAQYTFGQNALANSQAFSQMPMSTGQTQATGGAYTGEAIQLSEMSDADTAAVNQAQQATKNQKGSDIGGLGSALGGGGSSGGGGASGGW